MLEVTPGWAIDIDRGPDWLFVRLHPEHSRCVEADGLANGLWELLQQQFVHRMVLEFDDVTYLPSELLGELVRLRKRIAINGGLLRLCGLSGENRELLHMTRLDRCFPVYEDRADAVKGLVRSKPR